MKNKKIGHIPVRSSFVCAYIFSRRPEGVRHLILKRKSRYMFGLWQQVAGAVEVGETAIEAVLREIKEETGNSPIALYSADLTESFFNADYNCIELIPVFVAEFDPKATIALSPEHSEFKWVTVAEAQEHFAFHLQKESVELLEREFVQKIPPEELKIKISPGG